MELPPAEAFHERVILLQHRARLVAVRIVMVMFLVWVVMLQQEVTLAHLSPWRLPTFQRLVTVLHLATSSVVD